MVREWQERVNLRELFNWLKKKGLIKKNRDIGENILSDFKASFFNNKILIPRGIRKVRKDRGMFVLLHEEYHCTHFSWQKTGIITSFILGSLIGIYNYSKSYNLLISSFIGLFSLLIIAYFFIPLMRIEEYNADRYSSLNIIKNFPELKPSNIFKDIFFKKSKTKKDINLFNKITTFLSRLFPYHPNTKKRLKRIEDFEKIKNF